MDPADQLFQSRRGFAIFSTEFETGCVALSLPNEDGQFPALDSDGVECSFHVSMVTEVTQ